MLFTGDLVAHIKFTVLLMPNGSDRVTSHPLQELQSTKTVDDPEIKSWLALATKTKKKGGGKKKKGNILVHMPTKYYILIAYVDSNVLLSAVNIFTKLVFAAKKADKPEDAAADADHPMED